MTTPTEAPREALPEPLEVVAWKSPMWRFYPTRFNAVQNGEQLLDALVRLTDAQSALESECQAHAAEVERLRANAERTERNRDMWKGQCERQAEMLTPLRGQMRVLVGLLRECLPPLEVSAGIFESDDAEPLEALIERVATALAAIDQAIARGAK